MNDLSEYYSKRAKEYERIYNRDDPVRQSEQNKIAMEIKGIFPKRKILEVACGTGFWTKVIAKTARSVLATDASKKMISIAKKELIKYKNVDFKLSDAYSLKNIRGRFTAAYAHWWWSHMPKTRIRSFHVNLNKKLIPGAFVFFGDHLPNYTYRKTKIIYNKDGDRIEVRKLENRRKYYVIKNFPTQSEIKQYLTGIAKDIRFKKYRSSWELCYRVGK
jgi:SAM-dependent methyltransferase